MFFLSENVKVLNLLRKGKNHMLMFLRSIVRENLILMKR